MSRLEMLRLFSPIVAALSMQACMIVSSHDDETFVPNPDPDPSVAQVPVDEGATMDATPGDGVGVFVEYQGEGDWRVWTTCDSNVTGYECAFDVYLSGTSLRVAGTQGLEGLDDIDESGDEVHLRFDTDFDTDGVFITTSSALRAEVYVDGTPDVRFVFWVEDGQILQGAPSNPVDFGPG